MARKVWAYGRILVGVAALLAVGVITMTVVLKLAHGQDAAQAPTPAPDVAPQLAELRRLRDEAKDYVAAAALAEQLLAALPDASQARQQVEYEYGVVALRQKDVAKARTLFGDVVATYAAADFATAPGAAADPSVLVDDAQFYLAIMVQDTQDVVGTVAAYEQLFQQFPDSNRTAQALLRLGGFLAAHDDPNGALQRLEDVIARFPTSPQAPEAQLHVGITQLKQARYGEAAAAFEAVVDGWPDSPLAPTALQSANRALIHGDLAAWLAASQDSPTAATRVAWHADGVEANVSRALTQYASAPIVPGILLDAINYYQQPGWWMGEGGPKSAARVVALAEQLLARYSDAPEAWPASLELANGVATSDPARALKLVDAALEQAQASQDAARQGTALFNKGCVLAKQGRLAEARAAHEAGLQYQDDPRVTGEERLCIAALLLREGRKADGLAVYDQVVADEAYPTDVRAAALLSQAVEAASDPAMCGRLLQDVQERFPGTPAAQTAKQMGAPMGPSSATTN